MRKGQKTEKKLEFRLKNKKNRQKAGLKSCFWTLIGTKRDESAFLGRRAGRRVSVSKSGLSRRDRDGWQVCCPSPLPHFQQRCLSTSRRDACKRISAIQAVLKGRTMAIRKGNKHQLGLFFLLEACQRNAAGWSTAVWPANARLPLPHRRSSITRPCCSIERSSAKLLVFTCTCTSKFERSTGSESERVNALGLRAVEVIICMITRDFSVISMTSQASLSLSTSHKSHWHTI